MFRLPWRLYQQCGFSSFFSSCLSRTLQHLVCTKLAILYHSLSIFASNPMSFDWKLKLSKEANSYLLSVSIWSHKVLNVAAQNWLAVGAVDLGEPGGAHFLEVYSNVFNTNQYNILFNIQCSFLQTLLDRRTSSLQGTLSNQTLRSEMSLSYVHVYIRSSVHLFTIYLSIHVAFQTFFMNEHGPCAFTKKSLEVKLATYIKLYKYIQW